MLKFFGFDLELFIDEPVGARNVVIRSARDFQGEHWLIVQVDDDPEHLVWVCAPISVRALQMVATGVASARDAVRHSLTGSVEVVTVDHGRAVPDRCLCCALIPEGLLPAADIRVLVAA
jgi:hypothetical protein